MRICMVGGTEKLRAFLARLGGEVAVGESISEGIALAEEGCVALLLLPQYEHGAGSIPELSEGDFSRLASLMETGSCKLYIENYPSYDYRDCFFFGPQARSGLSSVGRSAILMAGSAKEILSFELLPKRGGIFFPNDVHTDREVEVLAEIGNAFGVHRVAKREEGRAGVALMRTAKSIYAAMVDLSRLEDYTAFSYRHWCELYTFLFGELLGISGERVREAFLATYRSVSVLSGASTADRHSALERAVREAVAWHRRSGILIDGGRGGVYEMIRSFDLGIAKNVRGDASMMTAALFMASGKYFGSAEDVATAEAIAHNILAERALQIEEGKNRGLFRWFSGRFDGGTRSIFVSDSSRIGNAMLALYRLSGKEEYRERCVALGEALLAWFGGEALLPGCQFYEGKEDLVSVQARARRATPEFYDAPLIFLKNLYEITGDVRYRDQVLKTAEALALRYPHYDAVASHSENFTYGRLFGALAAAQQLGDGAWTPVIDSLLSYFAERRHPSGGFADGRAYLREGSLSADVEFAVGLEGDGSIADLVYCQNTLAYSLAILLGADGSFDRALAAELYDGLIGFLLDSQIACGDPRLDGAWMRAFDMEGREYYGCDKDFAWGPACILTGWVTGAIPLVFLDLLGLKSMY